MATEGGGGRVARRAWRDFLSYLSEYAEPFRICCRSSKALRSSEAWASFQKAVDDNSVTIFKKQGCGYCSRAEEVLAREGVAVFTAIGSEPAVKSVLQQELGLPIITFPVIFVQGAYIGGFDQLQQALETRRFGELQEVPLKRFPSGVGLMADPIRVLSGPRGQPWYCFQLHVYANYVRVISAVHVVCFIAALALKDSSPVLSDMILWIVAIDMLVFTLMGPTPLAILSTMVTILVWRFRGPAVTSIPYKVVPGMTYVLALVFVLVCSDGQCEIPSFLNDSKTGVVAGFITNSAMLAILRF